MIRKDDEHKDPTSELFTDVRICDKHQVKYKIVMYTYNFTIQCSQY